MSENRADAMTAERKACSPECLYAYGFGAHTGDCPAIVQPAASEGTPSPATPAPSPSEQARELVANHETVAMHYRHWGATELGDAERMVLDFIANLEAELASTRSALREAQEDATRWRGLMSCERIRFLGSATAGYPEGRGHMGVEFWGTYAHDARDGQSRAEFIAFADGLAANPAAAGSTT